MANPANWELKAPAHVRRDHGAAAFQKHEIQKCERMPERMRKTGLDSINLK